MKLTIQDMILKLAVTNLVQGISLKLFGKNLSNLGWGMLQQHLDGHMLSQGFLEI